MTAQAATKLSGDPLPKLRSNHGHYLRQDQVGKLVESQSDTPVDELRRRFDNDGYVFVKTLLPREDVYDVRETYFTHLQATGILKPGSSPREGIFNPNEDPIVHNGVGGTHLPEARSRVEALTSAHSLPLYLSFLEHHNLRQFVRNLMGWKNDVLVKRSLLRHNVPNGLSTGIHYDRIFLRAGEAEFLTAWVPIGDCLPEGGGLMYLERSDGIGQAIEDDFTQRAAAFTEEERVSGFNVNMARDGQLSHDAPALSRDIGTGKWIKDDFKRKWLVGNYEAGDVVFHNPYMIHGATKNEDPSGRIRLSTDLRFYEEGTDIDLRWMQGPWRPEDGL